MRKLTIGRPELVAASDYIDAAQKYVASYSETRPVVRNGKQTGETKQVSSTAWSPGHRET